MIRDVSEVIMAAVGVLSIILGTAAISLAVIVAVLNTRRQS